MSKAVKLADIASALNVSTVTVSKALSDQKGVGNELRERIKKLAGEMGYVSPTEAKKNRRKQRAIISGCCSPSVILTSSSPFTGSCIRQLR